MPTIAEQLRAKLAAEKEASEKRQKQLKARLQIEANREAAAARKAHARRCCIFAGAVIAALRDGESLHLDAGDPDAVMRAWLATRISKPGDRQVWGL